MNQKNLILISVLIVVLGAITYFFISKNPSEPTALPTSTNQTPQSLNGRKLLSVDFPLKSGHKLYMEYDASIVPMGKLFDEEKYGGFGEHAIEILSTQIKGVDELSGIIGQISTKEQASAFVKFFTSEPTRHLLKPNPFLGIEPSDWYVQTIVQMPSSLSKLLTPAKIDKVGGQWVIERDLLMYPNWENQKQQTPAQLVRSRETISQAGTYTFSISRVLAEGDEVNNLLPYYL